MLAKADIILLGLQHIHTSQDPPLPTEQTDSQRANWPMLCSSTGRWNQTWMSGSKPVVRLGPSPSTWTRTSSLTPHLQFLR